MAKERHTITKVQGFRRVMLVFTAVTIALVVVPIMYYYVIPRPELRITTVYHEEFAVSVGMIKVGAKLENTGTVKFDSVYVELNVVNATGELRGHKTLNITSLSPGSWRSLSTNFSGSHYKDYFITLHVRIEGGSRAVKKTITHSVQDSKDSAMNIEWTDYVK